MEGMSILDRGGVQRTRNLSLCLLKFFVNAWTFGRLLHIKQVFQVKPDVPHGGLQVVGCLLCMWPEGAHDFWQGDGVSRDVVIFCVTTALSCYDR